VHLRVVPEAVVFQEGDAGVVALAEPLDGVQVRVPVEAGGGDRGGVLPAAYFQKVLRREKGKRARLPLAEERNSLRGRFTGKAGDASRADIGDPRTRGARSAPGGFPVEGRDRLPQGAKLQIPLGVAGEEPLAGVKIQDRLE